VDEEPRPGREVDETDVSLLDALHVNPRATFERLGTALAISPATAARRWERLAESGRAWVSSVPGPAVAMTGAIIEAEAVPGQTEAAARSLAASPHVISVYLTAGAFDLQALVLAADMTSLASLVLDHLPTAPGLARMRAHVGTAWYSKTRWRLDAISGGEASSVREDDLDGGRQLSGARTRDYDDTDHALYLALQHDGRARYRDLARELGTSEQLVRRRMSSLVRRGMLTFRTDFTRSEGGWPAQVMFWLTVPDAALDLAGAAVSAWPETRICLSVVGRPNVFVMLQLKRLGELSGLYERLAAALPQAQIADQRVVLRPVKSWGRLLDRAGHATGVVPVDPWAPVETMYDGRHT
jgi:DNA-binding Lrp family transcriptional regulator